MKTETRELKSHIAKIIEPFRLKCEFILRNGERTGKKCGKRARKSKIKGLGEMESSLCWRHRKALTKEYITEILHVES